MVAAMRGATSRWIGLMPITFMASISSRTLRAPRSEQMAEPTAPAMISEVTRGAACRSTPMPLTAPENEVAPIELATAPIWTEVMTPKGIATRIVGIRETWVMNQAWSMNSDQENRRPMMSETMCRTDSTARTTSLPLVVMPASNRPFMSS